jgi:hypothetical protein
VSLNVQFQVPKQKTRLNPSFFKSRNEKRAYSPFFQGQRGKKTAPLRGERGKKPPPLKEGEAKKHPPPPLEARGAKSLPHLFLITPKNCVQPEKEEWVSCTYPRPPSFLASIEDAKL